MQDQQMRIENKKLKEELKLYKNLISELPFSFTYKDFDLGIQMEKKYRTSNVTTLHQISEVPYIERKNEFTITSDFDLDFEKIEGFLSSILDYVPHHIVFIDKNGIITLCNLKAAKDLQVNRDEMIGKHIRELLKIPDEQIALLQTLHSQKPIFDKEILDRNYGITNTRIIYNSDGSIKRIIGLFLFLNGIKEAEKQALAGRIAAGIAHEIRNPLTTVRGYLQLLQSSVDQGVSELFTTLLIPEIDRANKIINDFLSISKPSQFSTEKLQIAELIEGYIGNFLNREAHLHNVKMEYHIHSSLKDCYIEGNRDELLQVFINLFSNSIQAAKETLPEIIVSAQRKGGMAYIQFADNGMGIKSSILNHIFDPFFSTKDDGTGLGLSVSKKIIENHKGEIRVNSGPSGTVFSLEIPIVINTPIE
ncbi:MAG: ATP-binding protein [Bacillota bacterium]|nr:ATP-binding protein [Bacillota bacterium]